MTTPTKKQIANGCRHFSGLLNETCRAGVPYKQFLYANYDKFPCRAQMDGVTFTGACPLFAWYTEEEIAQKDKAIADGAAKWLKTLLAGNCPECGAKVENKRQVGRCVYADPCGHRLYQGGVDAVEVEHAEKI